MAHSAGAAGAATSAAPASPPAARPSPSPTVPVVAAALAAAPARLGLRAPENSVDSYNVDVSYEPDEFVAFLDRRSAPRAPRLPWVARWVPGRTPPPPPPSPGADRDRGVDGRGVAGGHGRRWGPAAWVGHAGGGGGGGEGGLAPGGPSWANEWGSTLGPSAAATAAAAPASPTATEPSSPSAARPPLAAKPAAIRRVADVLSRGRKRPPLSTVQ